MFNPARLSLARRRRKLTKKALAEQIGCDQKTVIRYESGETTPASDAVTSISKVLSYPAEFFFGGDVDEPQPEAASFRSLSSMPARDRDAALGAGALAFLLSDWVTERFDLPEPDVLDFGEGGSPEGAARALRDHWGLGERPVRNMVQLLEAKGIRVFSLAENTRAVDAFSMWRRDTPFVFLNTTKTAERSRFDAAHELGHLVLHKHGGPQGGRLAEEEANQFASAFLMPEGQVRARCRYVSTLDQIVAEKRNWKVSVGALTYRLHKLGLLTEWQYRTFFIQINQRYGRSEPDPIERETSEVWQKVLSALWIERTPREEIARQLALPVQELEHLLFGLTGSTDIPAVKSALSLIDAPSHS